MANENYKIGDFVYAKLRGYPAWPAVIVDPGNKEKPKNCKKGHFYYVMFFGSKDYAWIKAENIIHHEKMLPKNMAKTASFKEAVAEMNSELRKHGNGVKENGSSMIDQPGTSRGYQSRNLEGSCSRNLEGSCSRNLEGSCSRNLEGSCSRNLEGSCSKNQKGSCSRNQKGSCSRNPGDSDSKLFDDSFFKAMHSKGYIIFDDDADSPKEAEGKCDYHKEIENQEKLSSDIAEDELCSKDAGTEHSVGYCKHKALKLGFFGVSFKSVCKNEQFILNIINNGYLVFIYKTEDVSDLILHGAIVLDKMEEVIRYSDIIISLLDDYETIIEIFRYILSALYASEKKIGFIEMSPLLDPKNVKYFRDEITKTGCSYLYAPPSVTEDSHNGNKLQLISGGDRALLLRAFQIFKLNNITTYFVGGVEEAAKMNIIHQTIRNSIVVALAETMSMFFTYSNLTADINLNDGERYVLNFIDIVRSSPFNSQTLIKKAEDVINEEYSTNESSLEHYNECAKKALTLSNRCGLPAHLISAVNETLESACDMGLQDEDLISVFKSCIVE